MIATRFVVQVLFRATALADGTLRILGFSECHCGVTEGCRAVLLCYVYRDSPVQKNDHYGRCFASTLNSPEHKAVGVKV